jgi:hypothetical protein
MSGQTVTIRAAIAVSASLYRSGAIDAWRSQRTSAHAAIRALDCRRSAGGRSSRITRHKTRAPGPHARPPQTVRTFSTSFKGARSAPGPGLITRSWQAPRARNADPHGKAAPVRHQVATAGGTLPRSGRRLPSFGPPGHVGAVAHSPPRPTQRTCRPATNQRWRASRKRCHPSGASS